MKHIKWNEIPYERVNDSFLRKIAWDGKVMIGLTEVAQGYQVPAHSHDNEQVTWVMSGRWRFHLEGKTVEVGAGDVARQVRSEVALLDDAVEAVERLALGDQFGHAALTARRGLARVRLRGVPLQPVGHARSARGRDADRDQDDRQGGDPCDREDRGIHEWLAPSPGPST